jgi:hypothetical protein
MTLTDKQKDRISTGIGFLIPVLIVIIYTIPIWGPKLLARIR